MSETLAAIRVCPAEADEAELISRLILGAFEAYRSRLVPESAALEETPAAVRAKLAGGHGGGIAFLGSAPAGAVLFKLSHTDVYLGRLAVLPPYQRRGVARALILFVETEAKAAGALSVSLGVRIALPDNQRLFLAAGYQEVARHAHPGFTEPTSIEMRKLLG